MSIKAKSYSQNKEFWDLYQNKIAPCVTKFDKQRIVKLCFAIIGTIFFFVLGLLFSYWLATMFPKGVELYFLNLLVYLIGLVFYSAVKKDFECSIKEKIMPVVCQSFGTIKWMDGLKEPYNPGQIYEQSGLIPFYNKVECWDDNFCGTYKDVAIELLEAEFTNFSFFLHFNKWQRVFKGIVVKFALNKTFNSHTVIFSNSSWFCLEPPHLKRMLIEDVVFEKKYSVFTDNEANARDLITPLFIERLKQIKLAFKTKNISCAFYNDLFLIAIPTNKDLFSIGSLVKPVNDPKQYYNMYEEMESIIKLIDYFKAAK